MAHTTPAPDKAAARELISDFSVEMTGKDVPGLLEAKDAIPLGTRINVTFLGNEDLQMRVAAAVGYRDTTALRRLLKKLAGATPSRLRQ